MAVLDADGPFCNPGSLNNEKQKVWHQHRYCVPKKMLRPCLVTNFSKFGYRVIERLSCFAADSL